MKNANSIIAFHKGRQIRFTESRQRILRVMQGRKRPLDEFQIADLIGKPINCVSGRITELKADKYLVVVGTRKDPHTKCLRNLYLMNLKIKFGVAA